MVLINGPEFNSTIVKHNIYFIEASKTCVEFSFEIFEVTIVKEFPVTNFECFVFDKLIMPFLALFLDDRGLI
jgi:hypothetical protein